MDKELKLTADYYSNKIREHGVSPRGVDWNGEESQIIRFKELSKIIQPVSARVSDVGCGYGAYSDYLKNVFGEKVEYRGYDLSGEMIRAAKKKYNQLADQFHHIQSIKEIEPTDYAIASGIFNVRQDTSDADWKEYIFDSLRQIDKISHKGFSFNILTAYSDEDKKRPYLYYAQPEEIFSFCKREFSKNIALLHDYKLYEFTILVRKEMD